MQPFARRQSRPLHEQVGVGQVEDLLAGGDRLEFWHMAKAGQHPADRLPTPHDVIASLVQSLFRLFKWLARGKVHQPPPTGDPDFV